MGITDRANRWETCAERLEKVLPQDRGYSGRGAVLDDRDLDVAAIRSASNAITSFWGSTFGDQARRLLKVSRRRIVLAVNPTLVPLNNIVYYVDDVGFHLNLEPAGSGVTYQGNAWQVDLNPHEIAVAAVRFGNLKPEQVLTTIYEALDQIADDVEDECQ